MNLKTFLEHFETIAEAPGGITKLKALILDLAVRGKLVPQNLEDEPAEVLRNQIIVEKQELEKSKKIAKQRSVIPVQETELPYAIPNNWFWCRWNDVALHIGDIDHKMPTEVSEGIPYVSPRNFKGANIIDFEGAKKISLKDFERLKIKVQPTKGDIIFPRYGTIGENRLVEVDINFLASYSCAIVKNFHGYMEPKYSYYYSLSKLIKSEIERYTNKTTQANVGIQSIQNFVYPLPPLAEQKRIVEKVDELMALCDRLAAAKQTRDDLRQKLRGSAIAALMNAETNEALEKSWAIVRDNWHTLSQDPKDVDDLRRSILQLAVQGKLTVQDPTDQSALLLASQIKEGKNHLAKPRQFSKPVYNPFEIPSNWVWLKTGDFYDVSGGIQKTPKRAPVSNYFPYLRVANVQRGYLDLEEIEYFELLDSELERWNLQSGDLLIVEGNGSSKEIGRCAIWNGEIEKCVHQNHIIRARPIGHSSQLFTLMFLNSPSGMAEMRNLAITTSGLYSLSVGKIREIVIPLPPLAEQKRIVAKVDELMQMCDRLEVSLRQSQQRAEALAASAISHLTI